MRLVNPYLRKMAAIRVNALPMELFLAQKKCATPPAYTTDKPTPAAIRSHPPMDATRACAQPMEALDAQKRRATPPAYTTDKPTNRVIRSHPPMDATRVVA
jgi:hypothetical protein